MKIVLKLLLLLLISFCIYTPVAKSKDFDRLRKIYSERKLVSKYGEKKSFSDYQEMYLSAYKYTKSHLGDEDVYYALLDMLQLNTLVGADFAEHKIKSQELNESIQEMLDIISGPETAQNLLYKGLNEEVIVKYPDSPYSRYARLLLAKTYSSQDNYKHLAVKISTDYLNDYKDTKLASKIYFYLAMAYRNLFITRRNLDNNKYRDKRDLMLKYSHKFIKEFPEEKKKVRMIFAHLGRYYKNNVEDFEKAHEYFSKAVKGDEADKGAGLIIAIRSAVKLYKFQKDYKNLEIFLDDVKMHNLNNRNVRKNYKNYKRNLEEIMHFGFNEIEYLGLNNAKRHSIKELSQEKQDEIIKFRKEWDAAFEKEWPEPKKQ